MVEGGRYHLKHWDLDIWKTMFRIQPNFRDRIRYEISAKFEVSKRGSRGCWRFQLGSYVRSLDTYSNGQLPFAGNLCRSCALRFFSNHDAGVDELEATGKVGGSHKLTPQQW